MRFMHPPEWYPPGVLCVICAEVHAKIDGSIACPSLRKGTRLGFYDDDKKILIQQAALAKRRN